MKLSDGKSDGKPSWSSQVGDETDEAVYNLVGETVVNPGERTAGAQALGNATLKNSWFRSSNCRWQLLKYRLVEK